MDDPILKIEDVLSQIKVSKSKLYRLITNGEFEKPVKQGGVSCWFQSDIDKYANQLKDARAA